MRSEKLIEVNGLFKKYSDDQGSVDVLNDINFTIFQNEILGILGPSGCGKSTLLRTIGELEGSTSGEILNCSNNTINFSFLFQEDSLFPWKTVAANIRFALKNLDLSKREKHKRIIEILKKLRLREFSKFYPDQLSGGMKQRTALARAIINSPAILVLDEPFSSLDIDIKEKLQDYILDIFREYKPTIVLVSHDLDEIVYLCNRVIVLSKRPAQIRKIIEIQSSTDRTQEFKATSEFFKQKAEIWKLLREEI